MLRKFLHAFLFLVFLLFLYFLELVTQLFVFVAFVVACNPGHFGMRPLLRLPIFAGLPSSLRLLAPRFLVLRSQIQHVSALTSVLGIAFLVCTLSRNLQRRGVLARSHGLSSTSWFGKASAANPKSKRGHCNCRLQFWWNVTAQWAVSLWFCGCQQRTSTPRDPQPCP